ncbi:PIR protein [Plasmodium vivax]|nr:PIR protein [Plasmodium vivax]
MKMSNGTAIPTIKELLLDENFNLREKELYLSYNELNKECKWSYRDLYCSDILTKFVDKSIRPLFKKLWNNFFKVRYFLEDFKYLSKKGNKICIYLKYWFYDQLLSENINDDGIDKFFSAWESTAQGYKHDLIGCEIYKMNLNEIKETKLLYDYFLLHEGYNNDDLVNHKIYVSPYCQYLKEAADVYKKRKSECTSDNNSGLCKEFQKYIKNHMIKKNITLFKGKCKNEEKIVVERMDASETISNPALKELVEKEASLKDVSIYKFYELLNNVYSENVESNTCDLLARSNGINGRHIYRYCNMLKELLDNWDSTLSSLGMVENNNKMCEYLNYWIHHKAKGNRHRSKFIKLFYYTWDILNNLKTKNNHCEHKNFNIGEREFTRKKDLYEFLEFYDSIKGKLENGGSPNNAEYCDYIKSNFEKYYYMVQEDKCKKSSIYSDETLLFQKKFKDTNEIPSLNEKCGGKYLDLVFKEEFEEMNSRDNLPEANRRGSYSPNADTVALTKGEFSERSRTVENVLKQLPSHKTYEKLNSKENVDKYCSDCMDILHLEFDHPGINHFCRMLSKNLRELSEMDSANSKDRCEYFTHWMNEEIWKKLSNSNSSTLNTPLVNILLNTGHTINNKLRKNHCPYDFNSDYTYKELQERKDLHDFFKNYKKIETKDSSIGISDKALCEYVSYIYKLYKRHIGGCCEYYDKNNHYEEHCQDYFKCDSKLNPNNLLIMLNCNEKESVEDSQNIFEKLTIDRGVILFTEKSQQRYKELATGNYYHPSNLKTLFNKIMQDGDPFYLAITSVLALLGVLLMFFVFYKFTPLGIWIDKTLKKSGNHYPYEEPRSRFIYSSSEPENIIPQGRRLNIAYHTA